MISRRAAFISLVATVLPAIAASQGFDRSKAPVLSDPAPLVVPTVLSSKLGNGAMLRVVEQHELPLVQVIVTFEGGARLDGNKPGIATFMAGMLEEGAGTRDAAALQAELAYLGASLGTVADWDGFAVSLKAPARSIAPALDLMADVIMRPTFREDAVRQQRDLRLAGLLQARDQPGTVAGMAFSQIVFPAGHPYHRSSGGDSVATAGLDSATVRRFYEGAIRPDRATFIVVGDVTIASAKKLIDDRFGSWRGSGSALPVLSVGARPVTQPKTRVYLVDKPGAAQSVITIGWPGVDRRSPDYAALTVMNTMLGGAFTSRLNMNLREAKGYSYGARSGFTYRKEPGPFTANAAVRTNVTDSSLVEFFKELRAIRDAAVTEEELRRAASYVVLGLPGSLEGTSQIAGEIADLQTFGLDLDELPRFSAAIRAVTAADVQRVAQKYLTPDQATVVVVGDVSKIRAAIESLKLGEISVLKVEEVVK